MTHVADQFHHDLKAWLDSAFPGAYYIGTTPLMRGNVAHAAVDIAWLRVDAEGLPTNGGAPHGKATIRAPQGGCELTLELSYLDPPRASRVRLELTADTMGAGQRLRFTSDADVADLLPIVQEYFLESALQIQHYVDAYENLPRLWGETLTAGDKTYTNATTTDQED